MSSIRVSIFTAALILLAVACFAEQTYLECTFDDKTVDQPIGTGGPAAGEPAWLHANMSAIVRSSPFATNGLELHDISEPDVANVGFELLNPVSSGLAVVQVDLWFHGVGVGWIYDIVLMSEGWLSFLNLHFMPGGEFVVTDRGGQAGTLPTYPIGRSVSLRAVLDLTAGMYSVQLDGTPVVTERSLGDQTDLHNISIINYGNSGQDSRLSLDRLVVTDYATAVVPMTWGRLRALYRP